MLGDMLGVYKRNNTLYDIVIDGVGQSLLIKRGIRDERR